MIRVSAFSLTFLFVAACDGSGGGTGMVTPPPGSGTPPTATSVPNLYVLAPLNMPVGVAVPAGSAGNSVLSSASRQNLVNAHFSQVTAENIMKPSFLHPAENTFFFSDADALVTYASGQGKTVHGHTLLWHNQLADWMVSYSGNNAEWTSMMTNHISQIVSHFAANDVVISWDVVNEAFGDTDSDMDGLYDPRDTIWRDNVGPDYLELAFRTASAADTNAELYYNDYNLAGVPAKLNAVLNMVDGFLNDPNPVPIHGIGFQMHISLAWPPLSQIRDSFALAVGTGLKIKISELDITVNTDSSGNPMSLTTLTAAVAAQQEQRFKEVVAAYLAEVPEAQRGGISVWGIADLDSWRRNYNALEWPLMFDDQFRAKPALQGFADGLTGN
jgi:endo-1,4-beta-xylanase